MVNTGTLDAPGAGVRAYDVVAVLHADGSTSLPPTNRFALVQDLTPLRMIAGGNGRGAVVGVTTSNGRTFRSTGGFAVGDDSPSVCSGPEDVFYNSFEVTGHRQRADRDGDRQRDHLVRRLQLHGAVRRDADGDARQDVADAAPGRAAAGDAVRFVRARHVRAAAGHRDGEARRRRRRRHQGLQSADHQRRPAVRRQGRQTRRSSSAPVRDTSSRSTAWSTSPASPTRPGRRSGSRPRRPADRARRRLRVGDGQRAGAARWSGGGRAGGDRGKHQPVHRHQGSAGAQRAERPVAGGAAGASGRRHEAALLVPRRRDTVGEPHLGDGAGVGSEGA